MISVWGLTDRGVVRKDNQDCFAYDSLGPRRAWGVVCDGMGGARSGDIASRLAVDTFQTCMDTLRDDEPGIREGALLVQAAEEANLTVFHHAVEHPECVGMGTTLVGVLAWEKSLWAVNVGDSRAYRIGKTGIRQITRDHSVVEDLVERGKMTPEQARFHPQKNLITRAIGTEPTVKADLFRETLEEGESILLCSDGLINEVTDQEIRKEILAGGTPEEICRRLMTRALERGAPDNVTIILFQL